MWEQGINDQSFYQIKGRYFDMNISTRTKKGIEAGRVCTWNIYMWFHNVNYGYVQIKRDFVGRLDDAKQYAENYLRELKESIPL